MTSKFVNLNFKTGLNDFEVINSDDSSSLRTNAFVDGSAPTNISLSNDIVVDNISSGTAIGTLTSTDVDPGETFTYTIVTDADSKFSIATDVLESAASFDFVVSASHAVTIRSTDSDGLFFDKEFTITVLNASSDNSITFDGVDEYINLGDTTSLRLAKADPFTLSIWAKLTLNNDNGSFISKYGASQGWTFKFSGVNLLTPEFRSPSRAIKLSATVPNSLLWSHYVITYDGTGLAAGFAMYANGSSLSITVVQDNLLTEDFTTVGVDAKIGLYDRAATNFMAGKYDETVKCDIELTSTQVTELYNGGVPPYIPDMSFFSDVSAWYRMGDNDTMPTVVEEIGDADGTAVNMTSSNISTDVPS
jgi:fermentation-respiration switch protein FrsA (DUF1100 family)